MMVVKKVFIIILSCLFIILIISFVKINITKIDNASVIMKIKKIKKDNEIIDADILDTEKQIESLKEENKDKWQELESWKKTKEKIEAALLP